MPFQWVQNFFPKSRRVLRTTVREESAMAPAAKEGEIWVKMAKGSAKRL
jgi:hypothetical protein